MWYRRPSTFCLSFTLRNGVNCSIFTHCPETDYKPLEGTQRASSGHLLFSHTTVTAQSDLGAVSEPTHRQFKVSEEQEEDKMWKSPHCSLAMASEL